MFGGFFYSISVSVVTEIDEHAGNDLVFFGNRGGKFIKRNKQQESGPDNRGDNSAFDLVFIFFLFIDAVLVHFVGLNLLS